MKIEGLPPWALPALAAILVVLVLAWAALRVRRRWIQGRNDLEEARREVRQVNTRREESLGPLTPAPPPAADLEDRGRTSPALAGDPPPAPGDGAPEV